jgi:hypothetical protein
MPERFWTLDDPFRLDESQLPPNSQTATTIYEAAGVSYARYRGNLGCIPAGMIKRVGYVGLVPGELVSVYQPLPPHTWPGIYLALIAVCNAEDAADRDFKITEEPGRGGGFHAMTQCPACRNVYGLELGTKAAAREHVEGWIKQHTCLPSYVEES